MLKVGQIKTKEDGTRWIFGENRRWKKIVSPSIAEIEAKEADQVAEAIATKPEPTKVDDELMLKKKWLQWRSQKRKRAYDSMPGEDLKTVGERFDKSYKQEAL